MKARRSGESHAEWLGHVFHPTQAVTAGMNLVRRRKEEGGGVPFFIPGTEEYLNNMTSDMLVVIMGRPSNYKSGVMQFMARESAKYFKGLDVVEKPQVAFYATWEQSIEDMVLYDLAMDAGQDASELQRGNIWDAEAIGRAADARMELPLYPVGYSEVVHRRGRTRLTIEEVYRSICAAEDEWGVKAGVVFLDYLQRVKPATGHDRRIQMMDAVDHATQLGKALTVPVVLGVQAKREVDYRDNKIPGMADGQECSNIEQSAYVILGLMYPKMYYPIGDWLDVGVGYPPGQITNDLLLMQVVKQKRGNSGKIFPLRIDPARNHIYGVMEDTYGR